MKLSMTDKKLFFNLTDKQKAQIVLGNYRDDGKNAEVAILLGAGETGQMYERVAAASKLYHSGRVGHIVVTGYMAEGQNVNQAEFMAEELKKQGVPDEAIILEKEAQTTKENMMYASIVINRVLRMTRVKRVIIVTSFWHLRRSVALAKLLLPRHMEVSGYAAYPEGFSGENWHKSEELRKWFESELNLLKDLVNKNLMQDIEY